MVNPSGEAPPRREPLPGHGPCFVCGRDNPKGMGLVWYEEDDRVYSEFTLGRAAQGPPGYVHGGATAAIIDEGMGKAVWHSGLQVLLATMTINYLQPAPLDVPLRVEAWVERTEGRKAHAAGRVLLADGTAAVEGTGLYIHVPRFFEGKVAYT